MSNFGTFCTGSSPRGRGKRRPRARRDHGGRLIPARAGKTAQGVRADRIRRAHPRAGGENSSFLVALVSMRGSSPRGRGKRGNAQGRRGGGGLIPARAGKTSYPAAQTTQSPAHPRTGGENVAALTTPCGLVGSSPRGRGKRINRREGRRTRRLIPARAGKTRAALTARQADRAHPRAGGENHPDVLRCRLPSGSSPRGRGKLRHVAYVDNSDGLIPARAGKTVQLVGVIVWETAHPRAGGENGSFERHSLALMGSSPRGRGKLGVSTVTEGK